MKVLPQTALPPNSWCFNWIPLSRTYSRVFGAAVLRYPIIPGRRWEIRASPHG